jgi:hypothetical protein
MTLAQLAALVAIFGPMVLDSLKKQLPPRHWSSRLVRTVRQELPRPMPYLVRRRLRKVVSDRGWDMLVSVAHGDHDPLLDAVTVALDSSTLFDLAPDIAALIEVNAARSLEAIDYRALLDLRLRLLQESMNQVMRPVAGSLSSQMGPSRYSEMVAATARSSRWNARRAAGLDESQIISTFKLTAPRFAEVTLLERGKILFVTAPIGSGKSDLLLDWLIESADLASSSTESALPILLRGDEWIGALQDQILQKVSVDELQQRGVDVVIDGLDEAGSRAETIAERATEFIDLWPNSRIILSSRSATAPSGQDRFEVPTWALEDAQTLIDTISTTPLRYELRHMSADIQETLKRPLFAIFAAQTPPNSGPYAMVESLVRKTNTANASTSHEDLAVAIIRNDGPIDPREVGSISAVDFAADRLVRTSQALWRFELPIYLQWFAAQGILSGSVARAEYVGSIDAFAKWRYVLAMAISGASAKRTDELLKVVAEWNPGAASWLLKEIKSSRLSRDDSKTGWDESKVAVRLELALLALQHGLPAVATGRFNPDGLSIAIKLDDESHASIEWSDRPPGAPRLIPFVASPTLRDGSTWNVLSWGQRESSEHWTWDRTLSVVNPAMANVLLQPHLLGAPDSVLVDEFAQTAWTKITRSWHGTPSDRFGALFDGQPLPDRANFNGLQIDRRTLEILDARRTGWAAHGPWAGPDLPVATSPWVGGNYSNAQLRQRTEQVYRAALGIYLTLSEGPFAMFGDMLATRAMLPASMILVVSPAVEYGPGLLSYMVPSPDRSVGMDSSAVKVDVVPRDEAQMTTAELDRLDHAYAARRFNLPETQLMLQRSYSMGRLNIFGTRPATNLAIGWLWSDLHRIGRLDSHFRDLN